MAGIGLPSTVMPSSAVTVRAGDLQHLAIYRDTPPPPLRSSISRREPSPARATTLATRSASRGSVGADCNAARAARGCGPCGAAGFWAWEAFQSLGRGACTSGETERVRAGRAGRGRDFDDEKGTNGGRGGEGAAAGKAGFHGARVRRGRPCGARRGTDPARCWCREARCWRPMATARANMPIRPPMPR